MEPTAHEIAQCRLEFFQLAHKHGYGRALSALHQRHPGELVRAMSSSMQSAPPRGRDAHHDPAVFREASTRNKELYRRTNRRTQ